MNVVVTLEHRFERTPDGAVWTETAFPYSFWTRYLTVFDSVRAIARVRDVADVPSGYQRADGEGVRFDSLPYYVGPLQYLRRLPRVRAAARRAIGPEDAVIMRVSSPIAGVLTPMLRRTGRPYGVEVVTDPYGVFAPGAVRHPLRPFFRWWIPRQLRHQCRTACAAAYVTRQALQSRYPPGSNSFATDYSSVELPEDAFLPAPREHLSTTCRLVAVGSLAQRYKGFDLLLDALHRCTVRGLDSELLVIGDGRHRSELEAQARTLGLAGRVCFAGQLPAGDAVRAELDRADLFVLPSRQEGLPRAMIEAMARGLPCIGSTVGGIPELLPAEDRVPPNDAVALAGKIEEVLRDCKRLNRMSLRNWETAREYRDAVLIERRNAFYRHIRKSTEAWCETRARRQRR